MCRNRKHSTLTHLVDRSLAREGATLRDRYFISDYDTQLALCMNNVASCFCPAMLLPHMREMSRHQAPENRILDFRVREIEETLTVDLVQMKYSFRPVYIRRFVSYLREAVEHVTGTSRLNGR